MKRVALILMIAVAFAGCNQTAKKGTNNVAQTTIEADVVNVLYFHPKQGCATCKAVGAVSKKLMETSYAGKKVAFVDIDFSEAANRAIVEKYEIVSSSLIIAKGNDKIDLTQQAFATALGNPQALEILIKTEVNKRLIN